VSDHDDDQMVADYLRRLTAVASALPTDRRAELIEEITAHIAEARAARGVAHGGPPSVPSILERLGDPAQIVQAAAEPSFGELAMGAHAARGRGDPRVPGMENVYDPYPGGQPAPRQPAAPTSVRNAVRLMYLGAAVSLIKVIVDLATENATRSAILRGFRKAGVSTPVSQLNSGATNTLALAFVLGLIGVALWILVARASRNGKDWARATGSVFFALDTLALLIGPPDAGIRGPETAVTRIFAGIIWLIGLAAVVFLWQKDSGVFFSGPTGRAGAR
jgi:hypothetical protein